MLKKKWTKHGCETFAFKYIRRGIKQLRINIQRHIFNVLCSSTSPLQTGCQAEAVQNVNNVMDTLIYVPIISILISLVAWTLSFSFTILFALHMYIPANDSCKTNNMNYSYPTIQ